MSSEPPNSGFRIEDAIAACAAGDRRALRMLYDAEAQKMLGIALRIVRRRAIAEEVVHDAFLRIWDNAAKFDGTGGNGRAWLYAILRNRALNVLRNDARLQTTDDADVFDGPSDEANPEEIVSQLSDESALKRCLERLDAMRRKLIILAYTEGLTHGEIAGKLNLPLGSIKSWIRRSLLSLRECMG